MKWTAKSHLSLFQPIDCCYLRQTTASNKWFMNTVESMAYDARCLPGKSKSMLFNSKAAYNIDAFLIERCFAQDTSHRFIYI